MDTGSSELSGKGGPEGPGEKGEPGGADPLGPCYPPRYRNSWGWDSSLRKHRWKPRHRPRRKAFSKLRYLARNYWEEKSVMLLEQRSSRDRSARSAITRSRLPREIPEGDAAGTDGPIDIAGPRFSIAVKAESQMEARCGRQPGRPPQISVACRRAGQHYLVNAHQSRRHAGKENGAAFPLTRTVGWAAVLGRGEAGAAAPAVTSGTLCTKPGHVQHEGARRPNRGQDDGRRGYDAQRNRQACAIHAGDRERVGWPGTRELGSSTSRRSGLTANRGAAMPFTSTCVPANRNGSAAATASK